MPSTGNKVNWSDIVETYSKLNTARTKYGFSQAGPTNAQGNKVVVADIEEINSFITEMQSNSKITSVATPVTPPTVGSLLKPLFLDTLNSTIDTIQNTDNYTPCSFNSFGDGWGNGIAYCDQ